MPDGSKPRSAIFAGQPWPRAPEANPPITKPGFWAALNPPIYLVSILPGVGVWQLTQAAGQNLSILIAATIAVIFLQHGINLLNDVSDWRLGADAEKWSSWVRYHQGSLPTAAWHGRLSFLAGGLLGLGTLVQTGQLWILLFALPMVTLGYLYNSGERPFSYTWAGEWVTGLCYGPGVVGGLWLLIDRPPGVTMALGAAAFGALAVALLLSHQPPQIDTDRAAGKHSFAVRYGGARTLMVARILFAVFVATWVLASITSGSSTLALALVVLVAAGAAGALLGPDLAPKRVLIAASAIVLTSVATGFLPA